MKSIILSIALLCSSIMSAELPNTAYQLNDEHTAIASQDDAAQYAMSEEDEREQEAEDAFEAFMNDNEDVPSDMIIAPNPVSPCEAYLKEIGVQVLMKYIALKIWLEHHWQSLTK